MFQNIRGSSFRRLKAREIAAAMFSRGAAAVIGIVAAVIGIVATAQLAACSAKNPGAGTNTRTQAAAPAAEMQPAATIRELMEGEIDPAADTLWDSVAYIANESGIQDKQPRTDEDWKVVRTSALILIEASNLLRIPGRKVAAANVPAGRGELSPPQIEQRIQDSPASFAQFARILQDAGLKALAAIDARDSQALMDAGGLIDEACEACHLTFWYPGGGEAGPVSGE